MRIELKELACIIPARKGSSRIPNKNLKNFQGKSLLQTTVDQAVKSDLTNIFISSNYKPDELGFKIPNGVTWISRPAQICTDTSKASLYIKHFFDRYPEFKAVMILQTTSPHRTVGDINRAILMYCENKLHTLTSVVKLDSLSKVYIPKLNEKKVFSLNNDVLFDSNSEAVYYRNGAIYICSKDYFLEQGTIFGSPTLKLEMGWMQSIDIDTHENFQEAEKFNRPVRRKTNGNNSGIDSNRMSDSSISNGDSDDKVTITS